VPGAKPAAAAKPAAGAGNSAGLDIGCGVVLILGGIIATVVSMSGSSGGGYIFWGAIVVGIWRLGKGLFGLARRS
jgi:hypothetical protein